MTFTFTCDNFTDPAAQQTRWEVKRKARLTRLLRRLIDRGLAETQGQTKSEVTYTELVNKVVHIRDRKKLELDFPKISAPSLMMLHTASTNPTFDNIDVNTKGEVENASKRVSKCASKSVRVSKNVGRKSSVVQSVGKNGCPDKSSCKSDGDKAVSSSTIEVTFYEENTNNKKVCSCSGSPNNRVMKPWKRKITRRTKKQLFMRFLRRAFVTLSCFRGNKDFVVV